MSVGEKRIAPATRIGGRFRDRSKEGTLVPRDNRLSRSETIRQHPLSQGAGPAAIENHHLRVGVHSTLRIAFDPRRFGWAFHFTLVLRHFSLRFILIDDFFILLWIEAIVGVRAFSDSARITMAGPTLADAAPATAAADTTNTTESALPAQQATE
jgi:hypothetical protein